MATKTASKSKTALTIPKGLKPPNQFAQLIFWVTWNRRIITCEVVEREPMGRWFKVRPRVFVDGVEYAARLQTVYPHEVCLTVRDAKAKAIKYLTVKLKEAEQTLKAARDFKPGKVIR